MVKSSKAKTLATTANLANLLPTGTVLAFETLAPSFSNNGACELANKYLTLSIIIFCSITCFISSFTDSFVGEDGKLYYGIATAKGMFVLSDGEHGKELEMEKYRITVVDFVHAIGSLVVFLVFAVSCRDVQHCFFAKAGPNEKELIRNLPLGVTFLGSFVFSIFPTRRRGIGFADSTRN